MNASDLDEFFARCDDVLADWRGSLDSMNTAAPTLSGYAEYEMPHQRLTTGTTISVNGIVGVIDDVREETDDQGNVTTVIYSLSAFSSDPSSPIYTVDTP